ncbi:MAG: hypothetical protein QM820_02355 [Minicystis sp.]
MGLSVSSGLLDLPVGLLDRAALEITEELGPGALGLVDEEDVESITEALGRRRDARPAGDHQVAAGPEDFADLPRVRAQIREQDREADDVVSPDRRITPDLSVDVLVPDVDLVAVRRERGDGGAGDGDDGRVPPREARSGREIEPRDVRVAVERPGAGAALNQKDSLLRRGRHGLSLLQQATDHSIFAATRVLRAAMIVR